jgi:predicted metallopeptidase
MKLWPFSYKGKPDVAEAPAEKINKNNYKNIFVKAIGFIDGQGASRRDFDAPEYNLREIKVAAEADSYIKMSLMKYSYMMFKAGYSLKGDNEKAVEYLKLRFRLMSFATGKPMDIMWQEIGDDIIKYSNAFLIKSRVNALAPGIKAIGVFSDKPVGGYFRIDPSTVEIKRDKNGTVLKYKQVVNGEEKEFSPENVIHFYLDKDSNNSFGTPRILAALEDVKLLRRIEGNIISLIYRFAIPIYQWIIGLPEVGFQATDKEIKEAQNEIEKVPLDGVIVTNEKTKIVPIGAEGHALDASQYLAYFEKRVFTALGVSESQMGRGGAKQDADSMEAQAHDTVKHIQAVMSIFVENYIINELLLEGGFNPIFNESDIVKYEFDEISLETKIKVENHELLKFQSNLQTFEETRQSIGRKPDVDEKRLYYNMVETKAAIDQIDAKTKGSLKIAKANSQNALNAGGAGAAGNGEVKSAKPNGSAKNNNMPTNQHGTGSVKVKESVEVQEKSDSKKTNKKKYAAVYKTYENLRNDIRDANSDIDILMPLAKDSMMSNIKTYLQMSSYEGMTKAVKDLNSNGSYNLLPNNNLSLEAFYEEAEETIKTILKDLKVRINKNKDPQHLSAVFGALEYRIRFLLEFIIPKVYWYSYVKAGAFYGIDKAYIHFDNSDDEKDHPSEINPQSFSVDDIPGYHSFCNCKVSFKAGEK